MNKIDVIKKIKQFLDGHDDEIKYLVNLEANKKKNYVLCYFQYPDGRKSTREIYYKPFLYIRDLLKHGINLYPDLSEKEKRSKMQEYGVTIKKLRTDNQKRLVDGYCYKITTRKSFNDIVEFLKEGGLDIYEKQYDEDENIVKENDIDVLVNKHLYYYIKPVEQFLISTGIRLYKGYDDYSKIHKVVFDIETTGLRYETSRVFLIGIKDNMGYEKILSAKKLDNDEEEKKLILNFFKIISEIKPSIVYGFNSEDFDFNFILGRAKKLGLDLKKDDIGLTIRRTFGNLKYGQNSEKYTATKITGMSVIDIHHAAKKTAAINSEMKYTNLKYVCQFENIAKTNRTYISGDNNKIGEMYYQNKVFLADKNNNYIEIPEKYQDISKKLYEIQWNKRIGKINEEDFKTTKNNILKNEGEDFILWYKENCFKEKKTIFTSGRKLLIEYLKDDLWETMEVDELYNQSSFMLAKMVPTTYERICTMGTAAVWELLLTAWSYENDLAIPHSADKVLYPGGLTRCFKVGFSENIIKLDYQSLYPMIQLTHDIFPFFDITGAMKMILSYSTTTRNIYKKIGNQLDLDGDELELLKNIDNELFFRCKNNKITENDIVRSKIKQLPIKILNNSLYGALGSAISFKWSDDMCAGRITCIGRIELRHLCKWFNDFGCTPLLAVTDGVNLKLPERTNILVNNETVSVSDYYGAPDEMWKYGKKIGIHALIDKFNQEEMRPPYMLITDDGSAHSVLNLYRINYAMLFKKKNKNGEVVDDVKLTGNTIKSNVMPEYIEEFLDNGLKLLLNRKGRGFIDYYNDYVDDIFYKRIPLKKIASKSKIKTNISGYLKRGKDKNGRPKGMQAHMELIIEERKKIARELFKNHHKKLIEDPESIKFGGCNYDEIMKFVSDDEEFCESLSARKIKIIDNEINKIVSDYMPPEPELDHTVYYVNTGYKKSHLDSKSDLKDRVTGKKRFASVLINAKDLEENPNMVGEYNVAKYLEAFNIRIEKFLVGFKEEIREKILARIVEKKKKNEFGKTYNYEELVKNYFTDEDLILTSFDSDLLDEALYLEKKETIFWNKYGYNPYKIWGGFKVKEGELNLTEYNTVLEKINKKRDESGKKHIKPIDAELVENDLILIKEGGEYSIGHFTDNLIKIIKQGFLITKKSSKNDSINKLKTPEIRNSSEDEKYFNMFKKKFKIEGKLNELSMDEFFMAVKDSERTFKLFVAEMEEEIED